MTHVHPSRIVGVLCVVFLGTIVAASRMNARGQAVPPAVTWRAALDQAGTWYGGADAVRIAANLVLYQRSSGGWPKNIDMAKSLTPTEMASIADEKDLNDSTIDNDSTHTQLRFLASVFNASTRAEFKASFDRGLDYLLRAQYPNGGWPQYFPLRTNYSRHITFNDNAMIGVMRVLRDVSVGREPFAFVDAAARAKAGAAVARGVSLIVKAQVRVNGKLTVWCAQHDEVTLAPAQGRAYEHPSQSGSESVGIVRFLMDGERPTPEIVAAIEGAVDWFRRSELRGLKLVDTPIPDPPHGRERVVVSDASAPPLWARFYEVATNRPIFSDRDGVIKYSLAEIGIERRTGYSWYGTWPLELLERDYPRWKKR